MKLKIKFPKINFKELKKLWLLEIYVASAVLIFLLLCDAWIYLKIAEESKNINSTADQSKVITLKKAELQAIDKKIKNYDAFLKNPNFTY